MSLHSVRVQSTKENKGVSEEDSSQVYHETTYCCCHNNSFATSAVLIETEIPSFCLEPGTVCPTKSTDGSYGNMRNTAVCLRVTLEAANRDICFLDRKGLDVKELLCQQY